MSRLATRHVQWKDGNKPNGYPRLDENGDLTYPPLHRVMAHNDRIAYVPKSGEIVQNALTNHLYLGDGVTAGGVFLSDIWQEEELEEDVDTENYNNTVVASIPKGSVIREVCFTIVMQIQGGVEDSVYGLLLDNVGAPTRGPWSGILAGKPSGTCTFASHATLDGQETHVSLGLAEKINSSDFFIHIAEDFPASNYITARGSFLTFGGNDMKLRVDIDGTYWVKVISSDSGVPLTAVSHRRIG